MDAKGLEMAVVPRRIVAAALAAVLAVTMCPAPTLAATRAGAAAGDAASAATPAGAETVYVVSGIKARIPGYEDYVTLAKSKLSYNKYGLIAKRKDTSHGKGEKRKFTQAQRYAYNKKANLVASKATGTDGYTEKIKYVLDQNGRFKKSTRRQTFRGSVNKYRTDYIYDEGRIAQVRTTSPRSNFLNERSFSYGKSGKLISYTTVYNSTFHPRFDSHGNVKGNYLTIPGSKSKTFTHKNTYDKKGRLKKSVINMAYSKITYQYTYKAVKVSKATAAKVKAQQWALLNDNLNAALGYTNLSAYFGSTS